MSRDDDRHSERMQEERRAEQRRQEQHAEDLRAEQRRQEQRAEDRRGEDRRGEQRLQEQRDQRRITGHWLNSFFNHSTNTASSRLPTSHTPPGSVGPGLFGRQPDKGTANASAAAKGVVGLIAIAAAAGLLGVLKRSFAQNGALGARHGSENIPLDNSLLVGRWRGNRDAGIEFGIEFRSDGSYAYIVGEPGTWQLAHTGQYCVRPSKLSGEWADTVLALTPTVIHSAIPGSFEQSALEDAAVSAFAE